MMILKMLQEGRINSEEATNRCSEALESKRKPATDPAPGDSMG